jgi:hypothetical protein
MFRLPFFALALLLMLASLAHADGAQSAAAATKAVQDLIRYTDGVTKANARPVFAKPPASDHIARILDSKALASLPAPQGKDMSWLVEWAEAMNKVNQLLIFTGAKSDSEADRNAAIERNMTEYEDVLFPAWAFMARMQSRMIATSDLFMNALPANQRTPVRMQGLAKVRNGHMQFVGGALTTIAAGVKTENARLLTVALRETAPIWTRKMQPAERPNLLSLVAEARKGYQDKALLDELGHLATAMETAKLE